MLSADTDNEYGPTIQRAMGYLKRAQVTTNPPGDPSYWFRHRSKGSWPLSTVDNGWGSTDTSGEATLNKDGSVSTFECQRTYSWLEILNPLETFRNIVVDYPTVECTSSVLQALVLFGDFNSDYRSKEIKENVNKAAIYIENNQHKDGSWYGTWGICFVYGTLFAIKGLVAAGRNYENSICIRKACKFLLSIQLKTGGWAESYRSCERQEHAGNTNCSVYFNFPNYRILYPVWALGEYHRKVRAKSN
ncbi:Cycloartenol synthase [Zea mays]|uniref:Cycloartenol synthase n=1 Tax=Zea mays TaxID=4577 RepID=A0A1D6KEJ9_MAIZE|nr:Cycloartenol synthase [Zea mays]